jgi:hypothetical protein
MSRIETFLLYIVSLGGVICVRTIQLAFLTLRKIMPLSVYWNTGSKCIISKD